jgi:purine-nucleoside phosphorylase
MSTFQNLDDPRTDPFDVAEEAAALLAGESGVAQHDFALVLGSGWSGAAELIGETIAELPSWEVPGFSEPMVAGHVGTIRSIRIPENGKHVLVLGARTHFYEGRGVRQVAHSVRTAAKAGASVIVLTNGCGGLDVLRGPGTPVLISDHLNLTGASPLEGAAFVDLTDLYSPRLRAISHDVDPALTEGVYAQFRGPQYETPAEVRMAGRLGADLVGMSTALEAIAARHAGLEVLGISLVTNLAAGISARPLAHQEVIEAGIAAGPRISRLLAQIVRRF